MNYTKGEWQFTLNTDKKHSEIDIFSQEGKGVKYIGTINAIWLSNEEKLANAHLIAAAPDMYEALEDIIKQAEKSHMMLPPDLADSIKVFGKQALAKAEGKEAK